MTTRLPRRWVSIAVIVLTAGLLTACGGPLPPTSWSGLTASGNIAYLAATDRIYAIDTDPGTNDLQRQRWAFPSSEQSAPVTFHSQPLIDEKGVLYVGSDSATNHAVIFALDTTRQGAQILQYPPTDAQGQSLPSIFGGLAYDGESIYANTNDGHVISLKADDLSVNWVFTTTQRIWSTPIITGGVAYATSQDHHLYALNATNGQLLWKFEAGAMLAGTPTVDAGVAYFGSADQKLYAVDTANGAKKWEFGAQGWVWEGPVIFGDTLYFGDMSGYLYAIDRDGRPVWEQPLMLEGAIRAQPLVTPDRIFVVTQARKLYAIDRTTLETAWTFTTPQDGEALLTTPLMVNNLLLIAPIPSGGAPVHLYAVDAKSGNQEWQFPAKQP